MSKVASVSVLVFVFAAGCDCGGDSGVIVRDAGPGSDGAADTGPVDPCEGVSCDDAIACTTDTCSAGVCVNRPDDALCAAEEICRVDMGCFLPPRCTRVDDPICDDGQTCTSESCDVASGRCRYENDDAACDDDLFCNGVEGCAPFRGCVILSVSSCDDRIGCTLDGCDEATDTCSHLAESRLCDDAVFCNGAETCDLTTGCTAGAAPTCDDGDACTTDACDATADACTNTGSPEVCNTVDDDCDGTVDEGVSSECGDCDPSCRRTRVGMGGSDFETGGLVGSSVDETAGGVVIRAVTSTTNYLWVPNTAESTLSRWDASTATELGRYRVGLPAGECPSACCWQNGCNMPSRVAIDSNGDAYVANRGFAMQGTVVKIAADIDDCVDRNMNGMIDTSTSAMPLPWNTDECILWTANVGPVDAILRALTVDRGDAMRWDPLESTCRHASLSIL